jgi:hypothetical protein
MKNMDAASKIESIARVIKDTTDNFEDPVRFYIDGEAMYRWNRDNPNGDWFETAESKDELASYKIIARAVLQVLS